MRKRRKEAKELNGKQERRERRTTSHWRKALHRLGVHRRPLTPAKPPAVMGTFFGSFERPESPAVLSPVLVLCEADRTPPPALSLLWGAGSWLPGAPHAAT